MKDIRRFVFLAVFALSLQISVAQSGIQFEHGSLSEVLAKAQAANKIVFIDAYTDWCGPCKWMAANAFPNEEVGAYFNEHFVNYKLDMEKGEGPGVAMKYRVQAYPSLLFVTANGQLHHKTIGAVGPEDLLKLGKEVSSPDFMSMGKMEEKFASGDYDRNFLANYIIRLNDAQYDYVDVLDIFRSEMGGEAMLEEVNWKIFDAIFRRTDTDEFKYVVANREKFEEKFGKDKVQQKLLGNYSSTLYAAVRRKDESAWKRLKKEIGELGFEGAEQVVLTADVQWYQTQNDWKAYANACTILMERTPVENANFLNSMAWTFYEHVEEPKYLSLALKWSEKSIELDESYYNLDTKAMLLYKLGEVSDAKDAARAAIEKAKEDGMDYSETEAALKKM